MNIFTAQPLACKGPQEIDKQRGTDDFTKKRVAHPAQTGKENRVPPPMQISVKNLSKMIDKQGANGYSLSRYP